MKYSFVIPTYNSEKWIQECVNSILAQTLQNFDLIIVDSGSSDGTLDWLKSIADERIKIYETGKRLFIAENWDRIKAIPRQEYMTIVGHDDVFYPGFLQRIDELIAANPEAGLWLTHFNMIDASSNIIRNCKPMQQQYNCADYLSALLSNKIDIMATGYVMRTKDYDEIDGIPTRYPNLLFADFELWIKLVERSYLAVAEECCFQFRLHQSVTGSSPDHKMQTGFKIFIDYLAQLQFSDKQLNKIIIENASQFILFHCKGFAHRLLRTPLEKRNGITVADFINTTKSMAQQLGVGDSYQPERVSSIRLAKLIDSNALLRSFFLFFKKLFPKPVM